MTEPLKPGWGISPPSDDPPVVAAWGARAIYTYNQKAYDANHTKRGTPRKKRVANYFDVELVFGRVGAAGRNEDVKALTAWLDKTGLPQLIETCNNSYLTQDSEKEITLAEGRFTLVASPKASHGYLYIGAWAR